MSGPSVEAQPAARAWTLPWWRFAAGAAVAALLGMAYFDVLRTRLPRDPADGFTFTVLLAAVLALFSFVLLVALLAVGQAAYHRRRLGAFAARHATPRDGAFVAFEGQAQNAGEPLVAPLSGRRCLAYEYEVWVRHARPPRRRRRVLFDAEHAPRGTHHVGLAGIALAPTLIVGRHGRARLLGWVPLDQGFPTTWLDPAADRNVARRIEELRRERRFERMTGPRGFRLIGRLFGLQAAAGPALQHDWCLDEHALDAAPGDVLLRERRLPLDSPAAASGLWSQAQQGVYGRVGHVGLELWPGTLAERRRTVLHQPLWRFGFLLLLVLALHGGAVLPLWRSDAQLQAERDARAVAAFEQAWARQDIAGVRAALQAGADPDRRDHYGDTLLMHAARERDVAWVHLLIEAGASVEATNVQWGSRYTALVGAVQRGREDVAALLAAAGARDFRVTERNGRPLPADGGAPLSAVYAYYQAIRNGDGAALVHVRLDPLDTSDINWDLWRRVRPFEHGVARGYWNDTAATLTLHARDAHGRPAVWAYHLVHVHGATGAGVDGRPAWRVAFEWQVD